MNAFLLHHRDEISLVYSCFDRILLNAVVPVLQSPASVVWFLQEKKNVAQVNKSFLRSVSQGYHAFVQDLAQRCQAPIVEPPKGERREDWVEPYYQQLQQPGIAVILKSRENARVAISQATSGKPHVTLASRFVWQYYFYVQDQDFGRMFLRICPYFPFNARLCLNGHEWLACQMRKSGKSFRQSANAFLSCDDPQHLQALADAFSPQHIEACGLRWLSMLVPYITSQERRQGPFAHRLFLSQVEYSTNVVFDQRVCLDRMMDRLLDLNRTIGRPDKLAIIFGRRIQHASVLQGLKTQITERHLANPSIRSHYKHGSIKQYVRDHQLLRTEVTCNHPADLGARKTVEDLTVLRSTMRAINERYLEVQQDVLTTFVDRGQLDQLRQPSVSQAGRRMPGLKLDDPRLLAVMQALVRFAPLATSGNFRTRDLQPLVAQALGQTTEVYTLGRLRYDLNKLRAKGLVEKVVGTQSYRLTAHGYRICLLYLKIFHRVYAPLTAASLDPVAAAVSLPASKTADLDQLYISVDLALNNLLQYLGLATAA